MKTTFLKQCAAFGVGAALLFSVNSARADDPKPKRQSNSETHDDNSFTPEKSKRSGRHKPSIDGRNSTSAKSETVGGASGRETRVPTGSHLPTTYERKSYTSNLNPSTEVYDRDDIRFKNSNLPSDVLRQVPGVNVGGSR